MDKFVDLHSTVMNFFVSKVTLLIDRILTESEDSLGGDDLGFCKGKTD